MRKYKPVEFQFGQEIEETTRRLRKKNRNLRVVADIDDLQNMENLRLKFFPFSLRDRKRAWLNSLPPESITPWRDLTKKFLMKYFPPIKNAKLRNEITSFYQLEDESLDDAREKFKKLLRRCPHHILCYIQLETFYNGLNPSIRLMVDALVLQ